MDKYELVTILDAQLATDKREAIAKQVADIVSKNGGKITENQLWLEKQKMAFRIKKCLEGAYYLVKFDADPSSVDKIKQLLRLNEDLLRFAIFRSNEQAPKAA